MATRKYTKKTYKKGAKKSFSKGKRISNKTSTKSLVSLIKRVSLKQTETKYTHISEENIQLYHNSYSLKRDLLATSQGITDTGTGTSVLSNRVGDEVIARGLSIKLWVANKSDRPNVMYRFIVFKFQSSLSSISAGDIFKSGTGNKIMDDINKEVVTVLYQKIFNVQTGFSAFSSAVSGDTDGREAHKYLNFYIPMKDKKIHYNDGGQVPKFVNYAWALLPYDSYGTLTSDNIASYTYQYKFYFKDP